MNGMESCLSALFGGSLFCLYAIEFGPLKRDLRPPVFFLLVGVNLAMICLARLDDVFLLISFCFCFLFLRKAPFWSNAKTVLALAAPSAVLLTLYFAFNLYSVGTLVPVSGLTKGGLALSENLQQFMDLLKPRSFSVDDSVNQLILPGIRIQLLMWFPSLISILFIMLVRLRTRRREESGIDDRAIFLVALLVYVLLKALYNLINVHAGHQGYWYYTLSVMVVNFIGLILFSSAYRIHTGHRLMLKAYAILLLVFFFSMHGSLLVRRLMWPGNEVYKFWSERRVIAAELFKRKTNLKLVEMDDGFISFSLHVPAIHAMGFVIDYQGFLAKQNGRFLDYCYNRGFDVIASLQYLRSVQGKTPTEDIVNALRRSYSFRGENLDDFNFEMVYFDPSTKSSFIRFWPKKEPLE
jgi:hypothetical protein